MKPNEITQRDIEKWARCSPSQSSCQSIADQGIGDAQHMFETMAARARLADLGEQTSALAHELRQPLFSISMANENLRLLLDKHDIAQPQLTKAISRIAEQIQRAQVIIDRTLAYASGHGAGAVLADISRAAVNAIEFLSPLFDAQDISIESEQPDRELRVALCQVEAEQVFVNLLRNALESIAARRAAGWQGAGRIAIRIACEGSRVHCAISDNGEGIAADAANAVFQPFFTTKPRIGTGLGLHICRQVIARGGGTVDLLPNADEGARVVFDLPLHHGG